MQLEFKAIAYEICKLLWINIVLDDLEMKWEGTMKLCCNNKSKINIAHNPVQDDRTKHVEVDQEKLDGVLINAPYI